MHMVQRVNVCHCAKFRVDQSNCCTDIAIFMFFFKTVVVDLLLACLDHPRRVFGGIYQCAKFGWNRSSSFNNMQVLIFNELGLKMPIHTPNGGFPGILPPKWAAIIL